MEVIRGKKTFHMDSEEFKELIFSYSAIEIEIGTGNGKFVYELAKNHPNTFFIGIDADRSNLVTYSRKIYRKPERGGLGNVLYVIAPAENLPSGLESIVNTIWIVLPWGSLLQGLILAKKALLENMVRISCRKGVLKIFVSYDIKYEPVEMERLGLPELSIEYIDQTLAPLYASRKITITERRLLNNEEMKKISSTWAKYLAYGRRRKAFFIAGEVDNQVVV